MSGIPSLHNHSTDEHTQHTSTAADNGSFAQTNIYNSHGVSRPTAAAGIVGAGYLGYKIGASDPNDGSLVGKVKGYITGSPKETTKKVESAQKKAIEQPKD